MVTIEVTITVTIKWGINSFITKRYGIAGK